MVYGKALNGFGVGENVMMIYDYFGGSWVTLFQDEMMITE